MKKERKVGEECKNEAQKKPEKEPELVKPVIVDEAKLKLLEKDKDMTTGEKLRAVRKIFELSQDELANLAGVSRKTIGQIEREECMPRLETLRQIENALGLKAYFLSGTDIMVVAERIEEEVAVLNFFRELKKKNLTDEQMGKSLSAALTVAEIFS